jgi:signal transduction histidine kinase
MSDGDERKEGLSVFTARLHAFAPIFDLIPDPLILFVETEQILMLNVSARELFNSPQDALYLNNFLPVALLEYVRGSRSLSEWSPDEDHWFIPRTFTLPYPEANYPRALLLRDISQFKMLNRNQNEFMRIVSHDLRSPLTSMQGFANMLELGLVGDLNDKQKQFVEKILSGISQLTALVENIQDAGRFDPDTGFYDMLRSQVDMADLTREIVNDHLVPAEKGELTIRTSIADDVPIIYADANMLERAITNLVDNAIKYTPNGGNVDVNVYTSDRSIIVAVKDTGLGISPENQNLVFQRHVRLPRQEHKKVKGSGLGLFIVKSVAQRHGGTAWVESQEGKGSTFYMRIPLDGDNQIF